MDTTGPVAQGGVVESAQSSGIGDQVCVIITGQPPANGDGTKVRQGVDGRRVDRVIVAGQGKVQASAVARGRKQNSVVDESQRARLT